MSPHPPDPDGYQTDGADSLHHDASLTREFQEGGGGIGGRDKTEDARMPASVYLLVPKGKDVDTTGQAQNY